MCCYRLIGGPQMRCGSAKAGPMCGARIPSHSVTQSMIGGLGAAIPGPVSFR